MAHTRSTQTVQSAAQAFVNVDSSGNVEGRGQFVAGILDITSYAAPEVVYAGELGLSRIYGVLFTQGENTAHAFRASVVASDGLSVSVTVDDAGSGTEAGADDIGNVHFLAWGEGDGAQPNS